MTPSGLRSLFRHHRRSSRVLKANPHRFRHTFGADMVRAGMSLPALMKLMVRPDETDGSVFCRIELAGESPVAVSAGAPRSRSRATGEIPASERDVKSPRGAVESLGRGAKPWAQCESVNLAASLHLNRKGGVAELLMSQRRQQTVTERAVWIRVAACGERVEADNTGGLQDTSGVRGGARGESSGKSHSAAS